jgi:ATP phosphoribosyltransferase regulatory subunit HisZ
MSELALGALVGVALAAVAALVKVFGGLHDLRKARLLLDSLMGTRGFDPRLVRLLAEVARRRRRLGLILALIAIGIIPIGWGIWRLASS